MSDKEPPFTPVTDIDANAWYLISEERVDRINKDFTMNLRLGEQGDLRVWQPPELAQVWQFHPVNKTAGHYSLRLKMLGPYKQLAVCHDEEEADDSRTKPCMMDSVPDEEAQIWEVADWGEGKNETVRFTNVRNGTDYWLDLHVGNPPFMASGENIDLDRYNPAQRWLYSSVSEVNDKQYSTVFSADGVQPSKPNPTTSADSDDTSPSSNSAPENDSNDSSSLSVGATAGIGIAVALFTIALAGLVYWFIRRKQRRAAAANGTFSKMGSYDSKGGMVASASETSATRTQSSSPWGSTGYQQQWNGQQQGGYAGLNQGVSGGNAHEVQEQRQLQELSSDKPPKELDSRPRGKWS